MADDDSTSETEPPAGAGNGNGNGGTGDGTPQQGPMPEPQSDVLSLSQLIGGPIHALVDAEAQSAMATARFIRNVGFRPSDDGAPGDLGDLQMARFTAKRRLENGGEEAFEVQIPMLSMLPIPALQIRDAELDYVVKVIQTEVMPKARGNATQLFTAEEDGPVIEAPATMRATFASGSRGGNRRSMDMLVKMRVHIEQADMPAGLSRLLNLAAEEVSRVPLPPHGDAEAHEAAETGSLPSEEIDSRDPNNRGE